MLHAVRSSFSVILFCSQFSQVKDQYQCHIWDLNTGCLRRQCYEKQLFSKINEWVLFKLLSVVSPFSATRLACALIIKLVLKRVVYLNLELKICQCPLCWQELYNNISLKYSIKAFWKTLSTILPVQSALG